MRATGSALLPLGTLALLAGFTFWLEQASQDDTRDNRAKMRHDPDYWVEQFTVRRFDVTGALQHFLTAKRMEHFPDDETTVVTFPYLAYLQNRQTIATANSGWLDKEGKHVTLIDNVRVVRPGIQDGPETVITTSILHVVPDDEYAHTDAPVTLVQGRTEVHGVGMEVSNKSHRAVVNGPVRGTIIRKPK